MKAAQDEKHDIIDPEAATGPSQHDNLKQGGQKGEEHKVVDNQNKNNIEVPSVPLYFGMPARTFIGSVFGYCVGDFLKKFSKKIAYYAGAGMMFLAVLQYNNWITINWRQIDKDLLSLLFRGHREAVGFLSYIKRTFTHVLPLTAGMYLGFRFAFTG